MPRGSTGSLARYRAMRDFRRTAEPAGRERKSRSDALTFVVQRHAARRLHYDFRLELDGVLKSWAVPKEPLADPAVKRLAVHVEDHPLEYADFEGTIPEKQYGAGKVAIWDRGRWIPEGDPHAGYEKGALKFRLHGKRLRGRWALIRMRGRGADKRDNWLLIKDRRDDDAETTTQAAKTRRRRGVDESPPDVATSVSQTTAQSVERAVAGVRITHADRVFAESLGVTKGELAQYYAMLGERLLVHLRDRPVVLLRCTDGDLRRCFVQRHASPGMKVEAAEPGGGAGRVIVVRTMNAVVSCVQNGAVEFHTWGSTLPRLERPDRFVLDLDPDPALPWRDFRDGCERVRELLDRLELQWFVKTTGGKGLHFVVPLARRQHWDEVKDFTAAIARHLVRTAPSLFVATASKGRRARRIFVDYLRNAEQASAVAAFSARARPGLPVSTPIAWSELETDVRGTHFTVRNVPGRVARQANDPWAGYGKPAQRITAAMRGLLKA